MYILKNRISFFVQISILPVSLFLFGCSDDKNFSKKDSNPLPCLENVSFKEYPNWIIANADVIGSDKVGYDNINCNKIYNLPLENSGSNQNKKRFNVVFLKIQQDADQVFYELEEPPPSENNNLVSSKKSYSQWQKDQSLIHHRYSKLDYAKAIDHLFTNKMKIKSKIKEMIENDFPDGYPNNEIYFRPDRFALPETIDSEDDFVFGLFFHFKSKLNDNKSALFCANIETTLKINVNFIDYCLQTVL
jgi:hypothetical protein